jgi:predicted transcriptional regulator
MRATSGTYITLELLRILARNPSYSIKKLNCLKEFKKVSIIDIEIWLGELLDEGYVHVNNRRFYLTERGRVFLRNNAEKEAKEKGL